MELLVIDAMRLWAGIPSERLNEAVEAAIVEAGGYQATSGLVARCWARMIAPKQLELGRVDCSATMDQYHAANLEWESLTPEQQEAERQAHKNFFGSLSRKLGGAV